MITTLAAIAVLTWGPIELDSSGRELVLQQPEADQLCRAKSERLPTIREFAETVLNQRPHALKDTQYPDLAVITREVRQEIALYAFEGYQPILKRNQQNIVVIDFYFQRPKAIIPSEDRPHLWTSSIYPQGDGKKTYAFDESAGLIGIADGELRFRCVD